MRKLDIEELKKEYVGKTFNWLTVLSVFRDDRGTLNFRCQCRCGAITNARKQYVLSGHTTSCGCYKRSHEKGAKYTEWCKNNPDKVKAISEHFKQTIHDNPDILIERGKKQSRLYKDHHEIVKRISYSNKKYWKDHQEERKDRSAKQATTLYLNTDHSYLENYKDIIHPDDYAQIFSRLVHNIRIKCPVCGNYEAHNFGNVFTNNVAGLKPGRHIPMCSQCRVSKYSSYAEQEIADYISTFYSGDIVRNSRSIIHPLELDLYYPEKKIAIEFNGDYWHNSKCCDDLYHYNKFKRCVDNGIILVSVYESEWRLYQSRIEQYLLDLFNYRSNSLSLVDGYMRNDYPDPNLIVDNSYIEYKLHHRSNFCYTSGLSRIIGRKYES